MQMSLHMNKSSRQFYFLDFLIPYNANLETTGK